MALNDIMGCPMGWKSWKFAFKLPRTTTCIWILLFALIASAILIDLFTMFLGQKQTFSLSDGDLVQCIPIQDLIEGWPLLRRPTWRTTPSMGPLDKSFPDASTSQFIRQATQLLSFEKQSCPIGTVPKRSRHSWGIIYLSRIWQRKAGRKAYPSINSVVHLLIVNHKADNFTLPNFNDFDSHKYAVTDLKGPYIGTQGRLSIWQPHVRDDEFSLAQVWVTSMDVNGKLHTLEAGWQIYRDNYRDSKPRLFVYWTADEYFTTGCYNLHCPGFIQVSNKWLLGGSFVEISTFESDFQYEIKIHIFKDRRTEDWWLQLNDDNVGYWPRHLFGPGAFNDGNTKIRWGGEVWHKRGHDTDTQMGNGNHPSSSATQRVAYVRNLKVVDFQGNLHDPPRALSSLATYRECCDVTVHENRDNGSHRSQWGTHAYFGGPGFHADCVRKKPFE